MASKFFRGLSALGAVGMGISRGLEDAERRKAAEADREFTKQQRARMLTQQQEDDAYRTEVRQAAAPLDVQSGEVYQPAVDDDGNAMPANPTAGTFKVGGQRFGTQAEADKAATDGNTSEAVNARVGGVMRRYGRFGEAATMASQDRQAQAAQLSLERMKRAEQQDSYLREFGKVILDGGGWKGVGKAYERYGDGFTASVEEDGKGGATVKRFDSTGKLVDSNTFSSLPEMFRRVAGQFDPAKWASDEEARASAAAENARKDRELKLREAESEAKVNYYTRAGRMTGGGGEAPASEVNPDDTFDAKAAQSFAAAQVQNINKSRVDAGQPPLTPAELVQQHAAIVSQMRRAHVDDVLGRQVAQNLNASKSDPAAYATEWAKATKLMRPDALAAMGFPAPTNAKAAAAAPAQTQASAAPAQPQPRPAARMAPAAQAPDPLAGMSPQKAREMRATLTGELQKWGNNPGAAGRVAEIQALIERIDNNQY